jgi:hypothetical protein
MVFAFALTYWSFIKILRASSPLELLTFIRALIPLRTGVIGRCFVFRFALHSDNLIQKLLVFVKMTLQNMIDFDMAHIHM